MSFALIVFAAWSLAHDGGQLCLQRIYTEQHLRSNPRQEVTEVAVALAQEEGFLRFQVQMKLREVGLPVHFDGVCTAKGSLLSCNDDANNEDILFRRERPGETYLDLRGNRKLSAREGADGPEFDLRLGTEDRLFKLQDALCR